MPFIDIPHLLSLPRTTIPLNLLGEPARASVEFALALGENSLGFVAHVGAAASCEDLSVGTFHSGLWRRDCAELFLADAHGRYLEVNLSPSGAWWACAFDSYRHPCSLQPVFEAQTWAWREAEEWTAALILTLPPHEFVTFNVAVVLGGCDDENPDPRNLHSFADLGALDFHLVERFALLGKEH